MSRSTKLIGLTKEAKEFLEKNCEKTPLGELKKRVYKDVSQLGMFNDGPVLYEYYLKGSGTVREIVQAVPWASGPNIFLCLKLYTGEIIYKWKEEEIENV